MFTRLWAGLLSFFTFFQFSNGPQQPNKIPETRTAPRHIAEYNVDFAARKKPFWLSPWLLEKFFQLNVEDGTQTDSLLVLHKGKLVYEKYADGWDESKPHYTASVTKTVVSALAGIAAAEKYIRLDSKVADYFPGTIVPGQESKNNLTVEHLLTMTSGIPGDAQNDAWWDNLWNSTDPGALIFALPQTHPPGTNWAYDSAAVHLLAFLLAKAVDENLANYAQDKLFDPLGMEPVIWESTDAGWALGGWGISMTPRDMARFGQLYANYGRWEGKQIIPADWVAQTPSRSMNAGAYGRLVWNFKFAPFFGFFEAYGAGGQCIDILPGLKLVLVRTGSPISA